MFAKLDPEKDPDAPERLLFIMQEERGVVVPSMEGDTFLLELDCLIGITNNGRFQVEADSTGVVTKATLYKAVADALRDHDADKEAHHDIREAVLTLPDGRPLDQAIEGLDTGKADLDPETGKIKAEQLPDMDFAQTQHRHLVSDIENFPETMPPAAHTHKAEDLPIIPIDKGGTGVGTAAEALAALIGGADALTSLASTDLLGLLDASDETGKKITLASLLSWIKANGSVQIQTGSYTGTGKYGPNNPNSLTFKYPTHHFGFFGI